MILFLGSPLLDIIADVDGDLLKKFSLEPDETVRATPELESIFDEVLRLGPLLQVGGSVCNTARVFGWITGTRHPVTLVGCVGADDVGRRIAGQLEEEGIRPLLKEVPDVGTGRVAVLLTDDKRSMVTHLGASQMFGCRHLTDELWERMGEARYFYVSAFSLGKSFPPVKKIVEYCVREKKSIILNLGASFLCSKYPKDFSFLFQNADVVFGNEKEFRSFVSLHTDDSLVAPEILRRLRCVFPNKPGLLVMTRGPDSAYVLQDKDDLEEYQPTTLPRDKIVDTNGAGDAFVGGFLGQYVENKGIKECVECGMWAAKEIIQHHGCNFDKSKRFKSWRRFYLVYLL